VKQITIATLLSGGEGVGVGARAVGLQHLWGIEIDDGVAQVARANGFNVLTADIFDVDPNTLERPDILHASPECQRASQAANNRGETAQDRAIARRIVQFIEMLQPRVFTLENVWPYRHFESFGYILDSLTGMGYFVHYANLNAADFGVPQTRRRLILRAVRGGLVPCLPVPRPWTGWYEAIADLIVSLPESEFAPWQLKRLPDALVGTVLVSQGISRDHKGGEYPMVTRNGGNPAFTVTANTNMVNMRAYLVGGQYGQPLDGNDRPPQVRDGDAPSFTVTAKNKGDWRVFIVDGGNAGRTSTVRMGDEPMFTVDAMRLTKHPHRVWVEGRVVQMTPRALARFQSFPDTYILPDNKGLACKVIGNAVPPLMYQRIIEGLRETLMNTDRGGLS